MAVMNGGSSEKPNAGIILSSSSSSDEKLLELGGEDKEATLSGVFNHLIQSISSSSSDPPKSNLGHETCSSSTAAPPMANRIKKSLMEAGPMFRQAIINTRHQVLLWTRRGTPLRALLVVSVGIVTLLALTGMLVFTLFFVAATVNAIVISLLISLAAAGGFLAIFFSCLTAIYITLLCIVAFVTFTITISSIIAALVAAGWIGLIWIVWVAVSKSATIAKRSLNYVATDVSSEQKHSQR